MSASIVISDMDKAKGTAGSGDINIGRGTGGSDRDPPVTPPIVYPPMPPTVQAPPIAPLKIIKTITTDQGRKMTKQGTIKWFDSDKGYGFISAPNGDCFLHASALEEAGIRSVQAGQKITFNTCEQRGRLAACDVEVADAQKFRVVKDEGRALIDRVFR